MKKVVRKIVIIGAGGCGKSSIASRLATGVFVDHKMTIGLGIDTWRSIDHENGLEIHASIFDLGGQEHFRFFQEGLVTGAQVLMLIFDVNRFKTLFDLEEWIPIIEQIPRERWILVGNKSDQPFSVTESDIKDKAESWGIPYVTISAKTGQKFEQLVKMILNIKTE